MAVAISRRWPLTLTSHNRGYASLLRPLKPCAASGAASITDAMSIFSRISVVGPIAPSSHVPDNGLPTLIHMDMLDPDKLLPAVAQASKHLDLGRISPHQTRRRRSDRRNSPLRSKAATQLSEDGHGGCVC